jgi:hypothetical protein
MAVAFCRWLTYSSGMPESAQCYDDIEKWKRGPLQDIEVVPDQVQFDPERRGYRLPTEAEWECAARSRTITPFSFGRDSTLLENYAHYRGNSVHMAQIGATLRPNVRGLFDMHGNMFEWCHDWYDGRFGLAETARTAVDPTGPETGFARVIRGGGWDDYQRDSRCAARGSRQPPSRDPWVGFRVVRTLPSLPPIGDEDSPTRLVPPGTDVMLQLQKIQSAPASPTGVEANVKGPHTVVFRFNRVTNATGYKLYRSESREGPWDRTKQKYLGPDTEYTDSGKHLEHGKTYYYRVRAFNSHGESALSAVIPVSMLPR